MLIGTLLTERMARRNSCAANVAMYLRRKSKKGGIGLWDFLD